MTTPTSEEAIDMARNTGLLYAFVDRTHIGDGIWANGYEWTDELNALVTAAYERGAKEALTQAATIIRADKWPWATADYQQQYNTGIEELAKRVEQIGEQNGL